MTRIRSVGCWLSVIGGCCLIAWQSAVADQPVRNPHVKRTLDVSLHPQGLLIGQLVNPQGKPKGNASIRLYSKGREILRTRTDEQGRFAIRGLKGGNYQLATAHLAVPVRAWPKLSAPPRVAVGALLVEGSVVRGQPEPMPTPTPEGIPAEPIPAEAGMSGGYSGSYAAGSAGSSGMFGFGMLGNGGILGASPLMVGAGVAAAVAIPVALEANDDDDDGNGGTGGSGEPAS